MTKIFTPTIKRFVGVFSKANRQQRQVVTHGSQMLRFNFLDLGIWH